MDDFALSEKSSLLIGLDIFIACFCVIIFSGPVLIVFKKVAFDYKRVTFVIGATIFVDTPVPMLHVVEELSGVSIAVLVEVLTFSMFFVFDPVSYIELSFQVVVLSFSMFATGVEFPLVPFIIAVC